MCLNFCETKPDTPQYIGVEAKIAYMYMYYYTKISLYRFIHTCSKIEIKVQQE